jgi:hypothetical protein
VQEGGGDDLGRRLVRAEETDGVAGDADGVTLVWPRHPPPEQSFTVEQRTEGPLFVFKRGAGR